MIEVFKTNVTDPATAEEIVRDLRMRFELAAVDFDLEDCDKILRIEADDATIELAAGHLNRMGHFCAVLED